MTIPDTVYTVPDGEPFGVYIRKLREHRGLSRSDLAKYADIHESTVIRIENGNTVGKKVHQNVFKGLARALRIPERYLRASAKGKILAPGVANKVCPSCWVPSHTPDVRWSAPDANYCTVCGLKLMDECPSCSELIWIRSKFCPECGLNYRDLSVKQNAA